MTHYFPTPWTAECFVLKDATGQALTHTYGREDGRETRADADAAKVLTIDEFPRVDVGETNVTVAFPSLRVAEKDGKRYLVLDTTERN